MFKRCRFIALMVCAYVFSCGIVGTACADVEFKVYAKQLILDGSLNMAFYVPLDLNATTKTASFTINDTEANSKFDEDVNITGYIDDNNQFIETDNIPKGKTKTTLYAFLVELTSVQMNDPINRNDKSRRQNRNS